MAKVIDITEKLSLEKPQIKIGDEILTVMSHHSLMIVYKINNHRSSLNQFSGDDSGNIHHALRI